MRQFFFVILFFYCSLCFSATIKGKVNDANTNEELVGAYIFIKDLNIGASVGLDGTFILKNIPIGNYILEVSYVSYQTKKNPVSITGNDEVLTLNILMTIINLDEVTIIASKDLSSENSARLSEKESATIMNVVSAKAIELSPDLNVANVLQRMSGITLDKSSGNGGQYALLRGMDKRYNYALINGVKIPSTNNKHRYVSLDIFPSDLVDRIEVTKAITADMEGDAIGGVINLVMKNAPDKLLIQANSSIGFSGFFADQHQQTFDTRSINLKSPYEINGKSYDAKVSDFSTNNLDPKTINAPLNYSGGLTLGNRFFNKKLGIIFSGNYQNTNRGTHGILFNDDLSRDGKNLPIATDLSDRTFYEVQKNYGLHGKFDYRLNTRHNIKLYIANIHFSNTQIRSESETSLNTSYAPEKGFETRAYSDRLRYNLQNIFNSTLQGDHLFSPSFSMNWSAVYSYANNATPDETTIKYATSIENFKQVPGFIDFDGSTRRWRYNTDDDMAAYLNLKYMPKIGKVRTEFSAGGLYRAKSRISFYNSYTLLPNNPSKPDSVFYSAKDIDWKKYSEIHWSVLNPKGSVGTSENFDAIENVIAYYGSAKINLNNIQLIGGIRIENTIQGYSMLFPAGEKRPSEEYTYMDILPSTHLKYTLNSKNNLRASYYKATNKPGFQEIVPFIIRGDDYSSAGNPDLKQASADNLDVRWEYFSNRTDQVMAGVFYKKIKNAIEYAFVDYLGNSHEQVYSPVNSAEAINYGLELDFTKYKRQWGIKANYTWTSSNISTNKLSRIKTQNNKDSTIYVSQTRPLFGQSAHVGNVSLLYMGANNGMSAQLAFSYTGERLYTVSRYINNDLWQKGFWQMDLSCEKRFKHGFSVFMKAQNLLNTKVIVFIKNTNSLNDDKPFQSSSSNNTLIRNEYSKQVYLLGIRYKFENKQININNN